MRFIGIINPNLKINDFVPPIFMDEEGNYFIQKVENDKILYFQKIYEIENKFLLKPKIINKKFSVGDNALLIFMTDKQSIIIGDKFSIFNELMELAFLEEFNPIAKLIIFSFYNIYTRFNDLMEVAQDYINEMGVKYDINYESFTTQRICITDKQSLQKRNIGDEELDFFILVENKFTEKVKYCINEVEQLLSLDTKKRFNFNDFINNRSNTIMICGLVFIKKEFLIALVGLPKFKFYIRLFQNYTFRGGDISGTLKEKIANNFMVYMRLLYSEHIRFDKDAINSISSTIGLSDFSYPSTFKDNLTNRCYNLEERYKGMKIGDSENDERKHQLFNLAQTVKANVLKSSL